MEPITLARLAKVCGGAIDRGNPGLLLRGVATDTRGDCQGLLYIPFKGEKFDGHNFINDAAKQGAAACVSEQAVKATRLTADFGVIRVHSTTVAYQAIASNNRRSFRGPVIAITGSCGKTTTKNLVRDVIGSKWDIAATEKNENNEIGVPRTLLRIGKKTQAAVLEFGMRAQGEIRLLTNIAMPDIAVITNVEKTHIGRLGSEEAIAMAKGELIENVPPSVPVFLNADNSWTPWLARRTRGRVVTFGINKGGVRATNISVDFQGTSFKVHGAGDAWEVRTPLIGKANVYNALAAIAVALELDMTPAEISSALFHAQEEGGRLNKYDTPNGSVIIDDTYNSNPSSLALAMNLLSQLPWKGRRVAILGDMFELGEYSESEHHNIGRNHILDLCDLLITIGAEARNISEGALDSGMEADMVLHFDSFALLKRRASTLFLPGDLILVKGSRGMKMERIVDLIKGARR